MRGKAIASACRSLHRRFSSLDLPRVVHVVRRHAVDERVGPVLAAPRLPGRDPRRTGSRPRCAAAGAARSRTARSAFQARSVGDAGRANQLLPFSGNAPRFSPVSRRQVAYFQYAACTTSSQMLWRPGAGRHAAACAAHAAERSPQVRPLPRALLVRLVQQPEQQRDLAHRRPPSARSGATFSSRAARPCGRAPWRMMSATAATITTAAISVRAVTASPAKSQPRNTATSGIDVGVGRHPRRRRRAEQEDVRREAEQRAGHDQVAERERATFPRPRPARSPPTRA